MRSLIILFFVLGFAAAVVAQANNYRADSLGIWQRPGEEMHHKPWSGQWIWVNEGMEADAILARRTFALSSLPDSAILRITASSQYQLFLNGQYIGRGPARSAPHHQSFDILDVSGLLKEGKNTLAIRVHHQKEINSYNFKGRGGLLAQLDMVSGLKYYTIYSDNNWKVTPDPAWDSQAPKISRFHQIVNDRVDLRNAIRDWQKLNFEDSNWAHATVLIRETGWPSIQPNATPNELVPPWTSLVAREVPYLVETPIRASHLVQAVQITVSDSILEPVEVSRKIAPQIARGMESYFKKNEPLVVPKVGTGKAWFLMFDLGEVINGTPTLEIQGSSGTPVEVASTPFLIEEAFHYKILDSEFLDRIELSGNRDLWEATYFKPARYLGIVLRNRKEAVKLFSVGSHQIKYPFEKTGTMKSGESPWVMDYFDATAKTIQVCTTDAFTDNYRERRQYAQTGFYAALGNYWIFGDTALQRRYLLQTAQEQQANGMMPAYAPLTSDDYMIIMDSNCLWIRSLHNYLLYTGDTHTAKELLPAAQKLIDLLDSFTDSLGLLNDPPYAYWLDHALIDRRGANFNLNGHYLGALEDFAKILSWLNKPGAETYIAKANTLRQSLQTYLWDEEKQLFADALIAGKRSEMFSEHSNGIALALNIATPEQANKIVNKLLLKDKHNFIKRASGIVMVTPAMSYFLHKGLCEYGFVDESFKMFRDRFNHMLGPQTNGTLWEEWWLKGTGRTGKFDSRKTRSDAQTESAFAPMLFAEYLLGIKPTKPGMKELLVRKPHELHSIEARFPSPEGPAFVKWIKGKPGSNKLVLEIPGEMIVKIPIETLDISGGRSILVNGKSIELDPEDSSNLILTNGVHTIQF